MNDEAWLVYLCATYGHVYRWSAADTSRVVPWGTPCSRCGARFGVLPPLGLKT